MHGDPPPGFAVTPGETAEAGDLQTDAVAAHCGASNPRKPNPTVRRYLFLRRSADSRRASPWRRLLLDAGVLGRHEIPRRGRAT